MSAQHYKDIAQRLVNAENSFVACMEDNYNLTDEQARAVFNLYKKEKVLKVDAVMGSWSVKHGAFLDEQTIKNAVSATEAQA